MNIEKALDASAATPELWAALAKAQGAIATVGKDGTNTQRGYQYSTADAMLAAGRTVLSKNGLSMISTFEALEGHRPAGDIGNQHIAARVLIWWVLGHEGGGIIKGCATMDAIGSKARPPDKAVAAAVTYGLGFVMRGLLNIDRGEEDEHSPDRRPEPEPLSPKMQSLMRATAAVATVLDISEGAARRMVKDRAQCWPDYPTDEEAERLTAAAKSIIAEAKAPKEPDPKTAAYAAFKAAGAAYVDRRSADYQDAEGRPPPKALVDNFRARALAIACEAAGVQEWPGQAATVEQLQAATAAIAAAKPMDDEAARAKPRDDWRVAQRAYVAVRGADHQRAEGQPPSDDHHASYLAETLEISAIAAGGEWPARPTAQQFSAAAEALRAATADFPEGR